VWLSRTPPTISAVPNLYTLLGQRRRQTWYDTLGEVISRLPAQDASGLIDHITGSNEMVAQVNSLLLQVQRDPASASNVASAIIGMKGVPGIVRDLAGNLPSAAKDQSGVAMMLLISQIQSALPRSRWF
jgi:hypothetical protein